MTCGAVAHVNTEHLSELSLGDRPGRRTTGSSLVTSTIVDSIPTSQAPPSRTSQPGLKGLPSHGRPSWTHCPVLIRRRKRYLWSAKSVDKRQRDRMGWHANANRIVATRNRFIYLFRPFDDKGWGPGRKRLRVFWPRRKSISRSKLLQRSNVNDNRLPFAVLWQQNRFDGIVIARIRSFDRTLSRSAFRPVTFLQRSGG